MMPRGPLLEQHDWDGTPLRRWRMEQGLEAAQAAKRLGVSLASYYRFESGYVPRVEIANRIVAMTRGDVRYRDIYRTFLPEYA